MGHLLTSQVICRGVCCGGKCGGAPVEARYGEVTIELAPCPFLVAQGWRGDVAEVLWLSQGLDLTPAGAQAMDVRHADGLVVTGGRL